MTESYSLNKGTGSGNDHLVKIQPCDGGSAQYARATFAPLMTSANRSGPSTLQPHIVLNNTLTFTSAASTSSLNVSAANLNRPTSSTAGESKVIYTTLPVSKALNSRPTGTPTFVSLQDVKSYPNLITTMVDSNSLQAKQTGLAIPLKPGMRIIAPHSTGMTQPTATLKRTNSDMDNPIITKVIITNSAAKTSCDQDGNKIQRPGTYLLASPSKTLTFTTDSVSGLGQSIVMKQPANPSKKILLKPSGGVFNFNKLTSPEKKGELAPGTKLHCIKLVTSTPPKCNSDPNKVVIGKVKSIPEMASTSVPISQPTVVSIQKPLQISKPGQRVLIPAPANLKPANPTVIRTMDPNMVTFTQQSGQPLQNFVMVPTQYISTAGGSAAAPAAPTGQVVISNLEPAVKKVVSIQPKFTPSQPAAAQPPAAQPPNNFTNGVSAEVNPNDPRPRKPCNCTKSQCLKLYCDCFANGEFCNMCNCTNCYNNLDHEEERQKAIKACLDRNPLAFHPKIGKCKSGDHERRHTKGCNCKRSGCLKNYCECYEAKILCTALCKCVSCKNYEDSSERKTLMHLADAAEVRVQQQAAAKTRLTSHIPLRPALTSGERLPFALITDEVIEASSQCLLAQAEDGEKSDLPESTIEQLILEEFGRCLLQIIDCSNKTKN